MTTAALVLGTSTGGVGRHVISLTGLLPTLGFDVVVIGPAATDAAFGFSARGVEFRAVEIGSAPRLAADVRALRRLRAVLDDVDVVHAHGFRAAAFAGLALGRRRPGRLPLVATWHNAVLGAGPRRWLLTGLERLAATRADVTLGASSDLVARALRLGARSARLAAVAAPRLGPTSRPREAVRAELAAGDRPVIIAVGRLAPQKDFHTLLRAARLLAGRSLPIPLVVIVGDGPLRSEFQAEIDRNSLPVRLLGHRDDIADLLAAADVYVLTSRWEARALVVQEALLAGVPVVATAVGGIPELVEDAALLVRAGDDRGIAEAVGRLLDTPELRQQCVQRGRRVAATWPGEADTARQVAAVYAELLPR